MADLTLYHIAPSRSSTVLWMLEELGVPYDVHLLSMQNGDNRKPDYLAVNPMGKVPALRHGDVVITEVGAILEYLADAFPAAKLAPPIGDPRRGPYLKWQHFRVGVVEAAFMDKLLQRPEAPKSALGYGDFDTAMDVLAAGLRPGPWLLGDAFSAADVGIGSALHWAGMMKALPDKPEFKAYVERCTARPAFKRATAKDQELGQG